MRGQGDTVSLAVAPTAGLLAVPCPPCSHGRCRSIHLGTPAQPTAMTSRCRRPAFGELATLVDQSNAHSPASELSLWWTRCHAIYPLGARVALTWQLWVALRGAAWQSCQHGRTVVHGEWCVLSASRRQCGSGGGRRKLPVSLCCPWLKAQTRMGIDTQAVFGAALRGAFVHRGRVHGPALSTGDGCIAGTLGGAGGSGHACSASVGLQRPVEAALAEACSERCCAGAGCVCHRDRTLASWRMPSQATQRGCDGGPG